MAFAGVKVSFLEAAIAIVAPVDGLRRSRAGLCQSAFNCGLMSILFLKPFGKTVALGP